MIINHIDTLAMTPEQLSYMRGKRYELEKQKHKDEKKLRQEAISRWISLARKEFKQLTKNKECCCVCGKYKYISEAHHIYPLSIQVLNGVKKPIQDFVWLCPTHHKIIHMVISKGSIFNFIDIDDLVSDFNETEINIISELNRLFLELKA